MEDVRIETVDRRTETRVGSASVVRDIYLGDQLWGHVLEIAKPVTRYLLVESTTDLFAVNFSLKTSGDLAQVVDYARELARESKQEDQTDPFTSASERQPRLTSGQLLLSDMAGKEQRSFGCNLYLIAGLTALELMLYFQLKGLESGHSESVRVWAPVAWMYNLAGVWGAMSVLPAFGVLALVGRFFSVSATLQKVLAVLLAGIACLAFEGLAAWVVFLPVLDDGGFQPIHAIAAGLLALLGIGFGFLTRHVARSPLERMVAPKPSGIDSLVEKNKWAKAAIVIGIIAIIGGVLAMTIYLNAR